jgi:hypothetical protein
MEGLYDLTDLPEEFLRDPSCWLESQKVEQFLGAVSREYGDRMGDWNLMESVGHNCHELWSWGVLDSVLRMMPNAQDVYQQPHRFLSYFVSPAPDLAQVHRESESISFEMPWVAEEYPLTSEYLRAALEALPSYVGKQRAMVRWRGHLISIGWSDAQQSFFEDEDSEANFKPELVKTMRQSLELAQRELEERKRELVLKDFQIEKYRTQLENLVCLAENSQQGVREFSESRNFEGRLDLLKSQLRRLDDYMVRAQQLVTILVGQGRKDPQVHEAMKRVDWDYLRSTFPQLIKDMVASLVGLQTELRGAAIQLPSEQGTASSSDWPNRGNMNRQLNL